MTCEVPYNTSSSPFFGSNSFERKDSGFEMANSAHQPKYQQKELSRQRSRRSTGNFILMMDLRKKIFTFRDILDLPLCDGTESINELLSRTIKDLHKIQPEIISKSQLSEVKEASIDKVLVYFCGALKNLGNTWTTNQDWMDKMASEMFCNHEKLNSEKLVEMALATLDCITALAEEKFDMMDVENWDTQSPQATPFGDILTGSYSEIDSSSCCVSPVTPNSVLPQSTTSPSPDQFAKPYSSSPVLRSLRIQAVEKLNPFDLKRFPFHMIPSVGVLDSSSMNKKNNEDELATSETGKMASLPLPTATPVISGTAEATVLTMRLPPLVTPRSVTKSIPLPPPPTSPTVTVPLPPPPPSPPMTSGLIAVALPPPPMAPPAAKGSPQPPTPMRSGSMVAAPPPPPPPKTSGTTTAAPPPPAPSQGSMQSLQANGVAPPPPPPSTVLSLRPKKAQTKLRRSTQLGNLYRVLKGKLEGGNQNNKSQNGRNCSPRSTANGQQGMADALAEITKRSAYFQQIEEDVQKYASTIIELKREISTFKNNDMTELLKFHKHIESILEQLTDESQVLARFEGFPQKKLEALRSGAALSSKLNGILSELQNWKIETPLGKLLDKAECYFNKIKKEIDALERTKDEDSKKFQSQNISFDFHILVQIKESMVDVSSNCMELVLKESREEKAADSKKANGKLLWRAFQFAFRVYTFAGGHDDRADKLTKELAQEIQTDPLHQ